MVDKFCKEAETLKKQKSEDLVEIEDEDEDSQDEGLEFIDPIAQRKADLAEAAENQYQN